jgi:hypothetical protein
VLNSAHANASADAAAAATDSSAAEAELQEEHPFRRDDAAAAGSEGLGQQTAAQVGQQASSSSSSDDASGGEIAAGSATAGLLDAPDALRIIQVRRLPGDALAFAVKETAPSMQSKQAASPLASEAARFLWLWEQRVCSI